MLIAGGVGCLTKDTGKARRMTGADGSDRHEKMG